ncbi:hypothetical protein NEOKW01_1086 [Nematocida sp. AWRm80]|nr:hypothetical protein NEOKW01_1086 [Nematocida sp. AWRm80]
MLSEWLRKSMGILGVEAQGCTEQIFGVLKRPNGRIVWRFSALPNATVNNLIAELKIQLETDFIELSREAGKELLISQTNDLYLTVNKQTLYIEMQTITLTPYRNSPKKNQTLDTTIGPLGPSFFKSKQITSRTTTAKILLERLGTKKRLCRMCQKAPGDYLREYDLLIPAEINTLCTECYTDFHWTPDGKQLYSYFSYEKT